MTTRTYLGEKVNLLMQKVTVNPRRIYRHFLRHQIRSDTDINNLNAVSILSTDHSYPLNNNVDIVSSESGQLTLAKAIVAEKKIVHVSEMNTFLVNGVSDQKYGVTLLPKPHCPCAASSECYHIIAAQLYNGTYIKGSSRDSINFTKL